MRKFLLTAIMLTLVLCFAGCGQTAEDTSDTVQEEKSFAISALGAGEYTTLGHESFQQNLSSANFRCIDGGIYTLRTVEDLGSFICFTDDAEHDFVPLCSKSDCPHSSTDCDAYVNCYTYGFYNDRIYYVVGGTSGLDIWSMNLDGTDHCKVNGIILEDPSLGSSCTYRHSHHFDNGFVYFFINYDSGELLLGRLRLEEGAQPEYYNIDGIDAFNNEFTPADGVVYIAARPAAGQTNFYRCTLDSPPEIVIEDYNNEDSEAFVGGRHFSADKVRYYQYSADGTNGFYEWNAATGKTELIKEFAVPTNCAAALYDGEYIYLEEIIPIRDEFDDYAGKTHFFIFDSEYNLISTSAIPFDKKRGCSTIITATDEQILFAVPFWPEQVAHYINKSDISSEITWHEVS